MQVEHKTEKGTVRFELLPAEVRKVKLYNYSRAGIWYGDAEPKGLNAWKKQIPKGFILIGLTIEVNEEQAKMMVDTSDSFGLIGGFLDYRKNQLNLAFKNSLGSFKSLMQHLQVYEVNPYLRKGELMTLCSDYEKFKEAESRTGKFIVLFKPHQL